MFHAYNNVSQTHRSGVVQVGQFFILCSISYSLSSSPFLSSNPTPVSKHPNIHFNYSFEDAKHIQHSEESEEWKKKYHNAIWSKTKKTPFRTRWKVYGMKQAKETPLPNEIYACWWHAFLYAVNNIWSGVCVRSREMKMYHFVWVEYARSCTNPPACKSPRE